jgi:hypothetical protein
MIHTVSEWLRATLAERVEEPVLAWYDEVCAEVGAGCDDLRFGSLVSMASRHARRRPADLQPGDLERAGELVEGWNPERWSLLDLLRVGLVLSRPDLERESAAKAICGAVKYADVGELCAFYRSFAFLPRPADYVWQAGEGCRSNMNDVFEAIACDNPYPAAHFDEVAWRALVVKAIFVGAPIWRVFGLDGRLGEELATVALDLADERRSAGRVVQPELWACLGAHGGERAHTSMRLELQTGPAAGRRGAALAVTRAGHGSELLGFLEREEDIEVRATMDRALAGHNTQVEFRPLHPHTP